MKPATLEAWLEHIGRVHPQTIALGLDRALKVADALALKPSFPVLTVGGTNGKGSVCALLEAMLHAAGYRVGCYTSPHLVRYNERVRIGRREAADGELARAFAAVEEARQGTVLTYFEFGTLAAMRLFIEQGAEVAVLEVGLGGRLDAVNAFDADCAVVVSVDLDHMEYLGRDREAIGFEKAGIFRAGRPAVCADAAPPASLVDHARRIGTRLLVIGSDFGYERRAGDWQYWGPRGKHSGLPWPVMRGRAQLANAAAAITAVETLREPLPLAAGDLRAGLLEAEAPARFQVLPGRPMVILDVAHNPHAARELAANLDALKASGRTLAVFAMLADKDIAGVVEAVRGRIDHWFVAALAVPRGAEVRTLREALTAVGARDAVTECRSVAEAYAQACDKAAGNDRILVFGSFYTVGAIVQLRAEQGTGLAREQT